MSKMLMAGLFLVACVSIFGFQAGNAPPVQNATKPARRGILLLAHGGRLLSWNEEVRRVADQVDLSMPTEIAFGMATKSSMQEAIKRLQAREVTEIVAVPLFVSSHSSVIDSTAYLLGLRHDMPEDLVMFASMDHGGGSMNHEAMHDKIKTDAATKPLDSAVPIRMAPALDHHQIVADILASRAASVSTAPANEVVVVIAHGPVPDDANKLWLEDMNLLATDIRQHTSYASIECLTLRDDADRPVRDKATSELRATVEKINSAHQVALVVPLLLSFGGIEDGLRKRLSGLTYKMSDQGLLPDLRIVKWVLETAADVPNAGLKSARQTR